MNVITLMGRLTRDPSYNEVENENGVHHIASFYLAVPKNLSKGVNYIKVVTFGKQADFVKQYLFKGKRVAVTGELNTDSYQDKETGKTMRASEVVASRIEFADGKEQEGEPSRQPDSDGFEDIPEEMAAELPFK